MGVDIGLTFDWTAVVVWHFGPDHRLVVDAIRFWRGIRQHPVSVMAVEDEIVKLSSRFTLERCIVDQWQSRLLAERLELRGVPGVQTVVVDPTRLDHMATALKNVFAGRQIRIPRHPELIEQLETITGVEQKRRDLIRLTSGSGVDAGKHDDLVVALALPLEFQVQQIGRAVLPASFWFCAKQDNVPTFNLLNCFLMGENGYYLPQGDQACAHCAGFVHVKAAWKEHLARGGQPISLREFRKSYIGDNAFTNRVRI
jgi:hypothetical protein